MEQTFYQCECGHETIEIQKGDDKDREIFFAMFFYGYQNHKYSFWQLLRHCWQLLRKGSPYADNVILSFENAQKLGKDLLKMTKEKK